MSDDDVAEVFLERESVMHPKFVCRREGHDPMVNMKTLPAWVTSFCCTCKRCGVWVEIKNGSAA